MPVNFGLGLKNVANYSDQNFSGQDLSDRTDMDNLVISNSCFSNETPDALVLPPNLNGVSFVDCNLDNVVIPPGNTTENCLQRRFQVQNDGEDWLVDEKLNPIAPLNPELFESLGLSQDPADIPAEPLGASIISITKQQLVDARAAEIQAALDPINAKYPQIDPVSAEVV